MTLAAAALPACSRPPAVAAAPRAGESPDETVAEVGGVAIKREDLDRRVADRLLPVRQQEYDIRREALDELVAEKLYEKEAAARGTSSADLLQAEVDRKVPSPSREQVMSVYEQNKPRLGGRSLEQMRPQIERMLRERGLAERRAAFRRQLADKAGVRVWLRPPRAEVSVPAGAPSLGPTQAPVTIVEFTDYQCQYCRRAQEIVDQVLGRYAGKVRFVHQDFPIDGHPRAFTASRAAHCAGEQGRFWPYHHGLLTAPSDFSDDDFRRRAAALGLDAAAFSSCLGSGRHDARIRASVAEGARLGVSGTPTFFINGRMLVGARPVEELQQVIDTELVGAGS